MSDVVLRQMPADTIEQLLLQSPEDLLAWYAIGDLARRQGDVEELVYLGRALFKVPDLDGAAEAFGEMVSRWPEMPQGWLALGAVLRRRSGVTLPARHTVGRLRALAHHPSWTERWGVSVEGR